MSKYCHHVNPKLRLPVSDCDLCALEAAERKIDPANVPARPRRKKAFSPTSDTAQCCACAVDAASPQPPSDPEDDPGWRERMEEEGRWIYEKGKVEDAVMESFEKGYTLGMALVNYAWARKYLSKDDIRELHAAWKERQR